MDKSTKYKAASLSDVAQAERAKMRKMRSIPWLIFATAVAGLWAAITPFYQSFDGAHQKTNHGSTSVTCFVSRVDIAPQSSGGIIINKGARITCNGPYSDDAVLRIKD